MNTTAQAIEKKFFTVDEAAEAADIGPIKLRAELRRRGYFNSNNIASLAAVKDGFFHLKMAEYKRGPVSHPYSKTLVTALGMALIGQIADEMKRITKD